MSDTIKILEVNACGNRQAEKKLKFHGDMDYRIIYMIENLLRKDSWDLISVRDIPWHSLKKLERKLRLFGYRMYIHKSWKDVKEKWRYTCLSALFVKNGIEFSQLYTTDKFETVLRYVAGKFCFKGKEILYKSSHHPCVDKSRSNLVHQIERKTSMLEDELIFQENNMHKLAICAGDYNVEASGKYYGQDIFNKFTFLDTVFEDTYEDRILDHVFISKELQDSNINVSTKVLDDYYMHLADHKLLSITLS